MNPSFQPQEFDDASHQILEDFIGETQKEKSVKLISTSIKKLNLWQKSKIRIFGSSFLFYEKLEGWKDHLPFYAFRCHKHGTQINYLSGWRNTLSCPLCFKEHMA